MSVYGLQVGIDKYQSPSVSELKGAVRDVRGGSAEPFPGSSHHPLSSIPLLLRNGQTTRSAVIEAFRNHLGAAREGDTALFRFSGPGSLAPVPARYARLEPSGS